MYASLSASAPQPQHRPGMPEPHQDLLVKPIWDGLAALKIPITAQLPSNYTPHSCTEPFPAAHVQALADTSPPVTWAVAHARQQDGAGSEDSFPVAAEEPHHDICRRRLCWPGSALDVAPEAASLPSAVCQGLGAGFQEAYPSLHPNSQPTYSAELPPETRPGGVSSRPSGWLYWQAL